jgi:hypothetical protein
MKPEESLPDTLINRVVEVMLVYVKLQSLG